MNYKKWNRVGTEKGWLVIVKTDSTTKQELKVDTVYLDSIREVLIEKIDSVFFLDSICFCVDSSGNKTTTIPKQKKKQLENIFKDHDSKVVKTVFKDTLAFTSPNGNKVKIYNDSTGLKINWVENNCTVVEENIGKYVPYGFIILFAGMIIGIWLSRK